MWQHGGWQQKEGDVLKRRKQDDGAVRRRRLTDLEVHFQGSWNKAKFLCRDLLRHDDGSAGLQMELQSGQGA